MVSTGSQYGNYNPAATDPYQIESVLAPLAAPDSAQARSMLQSYHLQNQANSNIYGQELDRQHDFNRQQLAQQLQEANMKAGYEYGKTPGGARMLADSGFLTNLGFSPESAAGFANANDTAQGATNLEHSGAGLASATAAGFQPSTVQAAAATGGMAGPQGDPTVIAAAKLRAAAQIQAAQIHAASQADPHAGESLPFTDRSGVSGTLTRGKLNNTQWEQTKREHGIFDADQNGIPKPSPLPMAQTDTPASQAVARTPPPPASGTSPQPGTGKQLNTAPNEAAVSKKIVEYIHDPANRVPTAVRDDVMKNAAANNGQVVRKVDPKNPQGGLKIQGASGTYY